MNRTLTQAIIILALLTTISLQAQVTIGSDTPPNKGALLDLTEGATTTKGLGLPRVKLKSLTISSGTNLATTVDGAVATPAWDKDEHIGLVVYNTDECLSGGDIGLYVWDGEQWQALGANSADNYRTATPTETSGSNIWGTDVILHQAKPGVYEKFISADFGIAGRWMITNLSAKAYDGAVYTGADPTPLTGPNGNSGNLYNRAYWAYPKENAVIVPSETESVEYKANPYLGLFYTWDAATAGKGGSTGQLNMDNPAAGNPANSESGFPEWDGTGIQPVNTQKRRQGICPAGWHLPSDFEWTELEQEITRHTTKYADVSTDIDPGGSDYSAPKPIVQPTPGTDGDRGYRGTTQGSAMKNPCTRHHSNNVKGTSKSFKAGGFNIFLPGMAAQGLNANYGLYAYFATSSSYSNMIIWMRIADAGYSEFLRDRNSARYTLLSVRCKKD